MAKKFKLEVEYAWNGSLLAIVCPWKDYKFAWKISKILDIGLSRQSDWVITSPSGKKNSFLLYQFSNEYTTFRLLKNKAYQSDNKNQQYLLPEIKGFDYLLLIESEADIDFSLIIKELKLVGSIELIKEFDPDNLKSKQNIAF